MKNFNEITQILDASPSHIAQAAQAIRDGKIVAFPTETVYGLGAAIDQLGAIAEVFEAKERPSFDPLIVHIAPPAIPSDDMLEHLLTFGIVDLSELSLTFKQGLRRLLTCFWPGPLTVILPKSKKISDLITSGLPTVAVRMPSHPVAQKFLALVRTPVAAPSANRFGRISPTSAQAVLQELQGRIPILLDGDSCSIGVESTVIGFRFSDTPPSILLWRSGKISPREIEQSTGFRVTDQTHPIQDRNGSSDPSAGPSPGLLKKHYAPMKPLKLCPRDEMLATLEKVTSDSHARVALLWMSGRPFPHFPHPSVIEEMELSTTNDSDEIARNLFSFLRALDESEADMIVCETPSVLGDDGLSRAIADRLNRAAHQAQVEPQYEYPVGNP